MKAFFDSVVVEVKLVIVRVKDLALSARDKVVAFYHRVTGK